MGIFDRFPYSSTHEMNLDFMLGKATEIAEDMQQVTAGMEQVQAGLTAISEKTEQATQAAAQAAASASSIEGSVTAAEEAAEEAQMHNESAQTWANNALTYKADCQRAATEAAASSSSAAQAATAAAASEDTVAQYAQAANASAQSAANNNDSAHQYANQASASASNATFHSSNAQTAATNAQTAATNANTSATNASASADRAAFLKTDVETLHRMCVAAVDQAATEAVNAANSAAQAAATKTDVETLVESLPEDFTDLNNTVNQLSDEIVDMGAYENISFSENGYIATNGEFISNANNWCTDFIALSNAIRLKCRVLYISAISSVAFYDKDKMFLSKLEGVENNTYYENFIEAPQGTEFVRITKWSSSDNSVYARMYSNIAPEHEIETEDRIKAIESNPALSNFYNVPFAIAGFLTKTNATITENANFRASNYINIEHCENITFQGKVSYSFAYLVFYDRGLKPLEIKSPDQSQGTFELTETINHAAFPDNAVYARFSTFSQGDYNRYFAHVVYSAESINNLIDKQSYLILDTFSKKYPHSIAKPIIFQGKNAVVFGDSIAYGVYSTETGTVLQKTQSFIDLFASANNITLDNQAISGTTITNNGNQNSIFNKIINYNNYINKDIIFIAGGTNDFNQSIEIGELNSTNDTEFFGALTAICEHLKTNVPNATVIFISPIPYTDAYYNKRNSTGMLQHPYKYGNLTGKTLNDYRNAIYEIVTQYGFNVVSGGLLGMPEGNTGGWNAIMCSDADGCHPTIMGHHLYAHNLSGVLL